MAEFTRADQRGAIRGLTSDEWARYRVHISREPHRRRFAFRLAAAYHGGDSCELLCVRRVRTVGGRHVLQIDCACGERSILDTGIMVSRELSQLEAGLVSGLSSEAAAAMALAIDFAPTERIADLLSTPDASISVPAYGFKRLHGAPAIHVSRERAAAELAKLAAAFESDCRPVAHGFTVATIAAAAIAIPGVKNVTVEARHGIVKVLIDAEVRGRETITDIMLEADAVIGSQRPMGVLLMFVVRATTSRTPTAIMSEEWRAQAGQIDDTLQQLSVSMLPIEAEEIADAVAGAMETRDRLRENAHPDCRCVTTDPDRFVHELAAMSVQSRGEATIAAGCVAVEPAIDDVVEMEISTEPKRLADVEAGRQVLILHHGEIDEGRVIEPGGSQVLVELRGGARVRVPGDWETMRLELPELPRQPPRERFPGQGAEGLEERQWALTGGPVRTPRR